jgi:hypothetical protein
VSNITDTRDAKVVKVFWFFFSKKNTFLPGITPPFHPATVGCRRKTWRRAIARIAAVREGRQLVHRLPNSLRRMRDPDAAAASRLEALAALSAGLGPAEDDAVGVLLGACLPPEGDGPALLRPLWAEEAMHRAQAMLRLFVALRRQARPGQRLTRHLEHALAAQLAGNFRALSAAPGGAPLPCSGLLREVARDLVSLFGPGVGQVALRTEIERVALPAWQRRALVVLASELLANALLHGFRSRPWGRVELTLRVAAPGQAWMRVRDDGIGCVAGRPDPATSVAGGLAALLAGELHIASTRDWPTSAEVVFPLPAPDADRRPERNAIRQNARQSDKTPRRRVITSV